MSVKDDDFVCSGCNMDNIIFVWSSTHCSFKFCHYVTLLVHINCSSQLWMKQNIRYHKVTIISILEQKGVYVAGMFSITFKLFDIVFKCVSFYVISVVNNQSHHSLLSSWGGSSGFLSLLIEYASLDLLAANIKVVLYSAMFVFVVSIFC